MLSTNRLPKHQKPFPFFGTPIEKPEQSKPTRKTTLFNHRNHVELIETPIERENIKIQFQSHTHTRRHARWMDGGKSSTNDDEGSRRQRCERQATRRKIGFD